MDTTILGLIIPLVSGAISALFWALMKEKDRQIVRLETQVSTLETKIEQANGILGQNTSALEKSNENDILLADLIEQTIRELRTIQEAR